MTAMAERMHRPYTFTVPERMLGLALGRAADELLLSSQKVRPQRLIDDGYRFEHADRRVGARRDAQRSARSSVIARRTAPARAPTVARGVVGEAEAQPRAPRVGLGLGRRAERRGTRHPLPPARAARSA